MRKGRAGLHNLSRRGDFTIMSAYGSYSGLSWSPRDSHLLGCRKEAGKKPLLAATISGT